MLTGASRRRLPRDVGRSLQPAFEQLNLPWLAPRLYVRAQHLARPSPQHRATATVASRRPSAPIRAQTSPVATRQNGQQERSYAYAASSDASLSRADDFYLPLVTENHGFGSSWERRGSDNAIFAFDPIRLLDAEELGTPHKIKNAQAVTGTSTTPTAQLHQNLEACLIVGLHERAASTMRRLNKCYPLGHPDLVRAHNFFIGHMIGLYNKEGDDKMVDYIERWLHVDMIRQGVQPNAATYAMMIQLMLSMDETSRATRGLRKYIRATEEFGLEEVVKTELRSVLNGQEFLRIREMAPEFLDHEDDTTAAASQDEPLHSGEESQEAIQFEWREGIPHVRAMEQKGEGLHALKQSLSSLTNPQSSTTPTLSREAINKLRQQKLEDDVHDAALRRWKADHELAQQRGAISGSLKTMSINALSWNWHLELSRLIRKELEDFSDGDPYSKIDATSASHSAYAPYLRFISVDKLSALTITTLLNCFANDEAMQHTTVTKAVTQIGKAVELESSKQWSKMRRRNRFVLNAERKGENRPTTAFLPEPSTDGRAVRNFREDKQNIPTTMDAPEWSPMTQTRVGAALLALLMQAAVLPPTEGSHMGEGALDRRLAFSRQLEYIKGYKTGVLTCDKHLHRELTKQPHMHGMTKQLPMLIPSLPWKEYNKGAYLNNGVKVARFTAKAFQCESYINLAIKNGDMQNVLKGLDVLGKVPWKVNRNVFDVFLAVWNSGEPLANIPPLDPVLNYPDPPSPDASTAEKREYSFNKKALDDKLKGFHSERCFMNFQLETARAFLNEEFYMPHNMDFRGRAYPIPPYLNHMGADHCRGLLVFARGKELGSRGLDWLKIQVANVYGFDKASLDERRAFAEEHLDQIYDSANRPLDGQRWWLTAEDPWQCLAACCELRDALSSPDPTKFVSHLPVHQDGTCNGLQHYAALGGDEAGAKQVNLEPGERPSDIYTAVAKHVKASVTKDAANGFKIAKLLEGKINRKVVKQTVMTNVYGVTFRGARLQVQNRLDELYPDLHADRFVKYTASSYIARKIFEALGTIFNGASAIQQWLGECVTQVCRSLSPEQMDLLEGLHNQRKEAIEQGLPIPRPSKETLDEIAEHARFKSTIIWTTPLGMPVVQPYRDTKSTVVTTNVQAISIIQPSLSDDVSFRKQLQAFPPNFIHSLDATHMLLSALTCDELGVSFAAVHDSFWTHAADVDRMSSELRNAFVRMHSEDIVGRLAAEFRARYQNNLYQKTIPASSALGKKVLALRKEKRKDSRRTKDTNHLAELLEERERQRLLASEDPDLRRQGEEMMTPASLYSKMDPQDMLSLNSKSVEAPSDEVEDLLDIEGDSLKSVEDAISVSEAGDVVSSDPTIEVTTSAVQSETKSSEKKKFSVEDVDGVSQFTLEVMDEAKQLAYPNGKPVARQISKLRIWLPVEMPNVPERGTWSVERLKKSTYFFS